MYNSLILTRPCFTGHLPLPDAVYLQQLLCQNYDMFVIMLGCNTDPYSVDSCNTDPYATQTTAIQTPMLDCNTDPYAGLQHRPLCWTAIQTPTKSSETCLGVIHIWSVLAPEAVPVTTKHHRHICYLHALPLNHSHSLAAQQRCLSQLNVWPFWMEVQVHTACM